MYKYSCNKFISIVILALISFNLSSQNNVDSIPNIIQSFKISNDLWNIDTLVFDTSILDFQNYANINREKYLPVWIGNYGLPYRNAEISVRYNVRNIYKFGLKEQLFISNNTIFFNTRRPITQVDYFNEGPKDSKSQFVRVTHTQNINPNLNAGFKVKFLHSLGSYARQETKNSSIKLWTSFEKENYFLFVDLNYNKFKNQESAGFENDSDFISNNYTDSKYLAVKLDGAQSTSRYNDFNFIHGISLQRNINKVDSLDKLCSKIISKLSLIHKFSISNFNRVYVDSDPTSGFYRDIFIDSVSTNDSLSYIDLQNSIFIRYNDSSKSKIIDFGFRHLYENYYCSSKDNSNNSLKIFARGKGVFKKNISWNISAESFLLGRYNGDYNLNGKITFNLDNNSFFQLIDLGIDISRNTQSWFYSNYYSNNFNWSEEFQPSYLEQFNIRLINDKRRFVTNIRVGLVSNFVYFDTNANPSQESRNTSFYSIKIEKNIHINKVWFNNGVLIQGVNNIDVLPVPLLNIHSTLLTESFVLNNVLLVQLGIGAQYQSEYFSPAYMPATGIYYLQNKRKIGNYPFINLFFNVKLKQVRFTFKYSHINQGLLGNYYFSTLHYASPPRQFTFGLSWLFTN